MSAPISYSDLLSLRYRYGELAPSADGHIDCYGVLLEVNRRAGRIEAVGCPFSEASEVADWFVSDASPWSRIGDDLACARQTGDAILVASGSAHPGVYAVASESPKVLLSAEPGRGVYAVRAGRLPVMPLGVYRLEATA